MSPYSATSARHRTAPATEEQREVKSSVNSCWLWERSPDIKSPQIMVEAADPGLAFSWLIKLTIEILRQANN